MKRRSHLLKWTVALSLCVTSLIGGTYTSKDVAHAAAAAVTLDGANLGKVFDGIGVVESTGRLLYDYPEPQRSDILDYLFKPNFGASLHILKVEIGSDSNNTTISVPNHKRTATEASNYNRGWMFWLMKEAKLRNPDIKLAALHWGYPAWANTDAKKAQWIVDFVKGARDQHSLTIDYLGGNQNESGVSDLAKSVKTELVNNNLSSVKVVSADELDSWNVATKIQNDAAYASSVDIIGSHYNRTPPQSAINSGKPVWVSEEGGGTWNDPSKAFNWMKYILEAAQNGVSASLRWNSSASVYDNMAWPGNGILLANQPWSGNYGIGANLWTTAHYTQFTKPGWVYVNNSVKFLSGSTGRFVTLKNPQTNDYSIIAETNGIPAGGVDVTFTLAGGLSTNAVNVWRTTPSDSNDFFTQVSSITPSGGSFTVHLDPNKVYTLSTTTGQAKGQKTIPSSASFPFPYNDNFDSSSVGSMPKYFVDAGGGFEIANAGGGRSGKVIRQVITDKPIHWAYSEVRDPITEIGNMAWTNYKVQVDVLAEETGKVYVGGRIDNTAEYTAVYDRKGYWMSLDTSGNWELFRKDAGSRTSLSSGSITGFGVNTWKTLELEFNGSNIKAFIGGIMVADVTDATYSGGNTTLGTTDWGNGNWVVAQFDNFAVTAVNSTPQTTITIDNGEAGYSESGSWLSSGLAGYNGSTTRYSSSSGAYTTWTPTITEAGNYRVFVMYPAHIYSDIAAKYTVTYQGGNQVFNINQEQNGSAWVELGNGSGFNFATGSSANVKLEVTKPGNTEEVVRADAVRFVRVTP